MRFDVLKLVGPESKRFANLPDNYIRRCMEQIYYKTPRSPKYRRATVRQRRFTFETYRPWTMEFKYENCFSRPKYAPVEPIKKWSFFRGDRVEILTGPDKGKQGYVKLIIQERNWVIVEGLNTKLVFYNKEKDFPGTVSVLELPLLVTEDVMHVDPSDMKPTEIEWRYTAEGEEVRVSNRTGRIIPIPPSHLETKDYKTPSMYVEGDKDTRKEVVEKVTFKPNLKTFPMDIMDKMNIKEERFQKRTFWY